MYSRYSYIFSSLSILIFDFLNVLHLKASSVSDVVIAKTWVLLLNVLHRIFCHEYIVNEVVELEMLLILLLFVIN